MAWMEEALGLYRRTRGSFFGLRHEYLHKTIELIFGEGFVVIGQLALAGRSFLGRCMQWARSGYLC